VTTGTLHFGGGLLDSQGVFGVQPVHLSHRLGVVGMGSALLGTSLALIGTPYARDGSSHVGDGAAHREGGAELVVGATAPLRMTRERELLGTRDALVGTSMAPGSATLAIVGIWDALRYATLGGRGDWHGRR
jgi:hypothetical protein